MFVSTLILLILLRTSQSASIPNKTKPLETLKKDVSEVTSAIENFTFDILEEIIEDSQETTTAANQRPKRSVEDDVKQLCGKRCEARARQETEQIQDLKIQVKKLQQLVGVLQNQGKIISFIDQTKPNVRSYDEKEEPKANSEELANLKKDLVEVIGHLNQTRKSMEIQRKKDELLTRELTLQREEIAKLKKVVETILRSNQTEETSARSSGRASELSDLRKLLKSLPEEEDESELDSRLVELRKQINKKRQEEALKKQLKRLEDSITEENTDTALLHKIIQAIKEKNGVQDRSDDITNLDDLQEAINRLKPKENDAAQFQNVLSQLITNQKPQVTVTNQQMSELGKKLMSNSGPLICVVDDGKSKSTPYQQFFPGAYAQQNYYNPGPVNVPGADKPANYQTETGQFNQKYQQDLQQQVDALQAAIDNLNRPEYYQRPEDKAIVDDLERQIGDLRNVVANLNYDGYQRNKRSLDNNELDDDIVKLVGELMSNGTEKRTSNDNLSHIQNAINAIRKEIDDSSKNPKARTAPSTYNPFDPDDATSRDLQRTFGQNDFLSTLIGKIIDKVISIIPVVIQKLLGFSLQELSQIDLKDYDIQTLTKNLGVLAYFPIIILRLLRGVSAFLNMLRKNSFFKTFMMPALILGTVAGSVLFLIWWLQPDDVAIAGNNYNYLPDNSAQNYATNAQNQQQYPISYNYPPASSK